MKNFVKYLIVAVLLGLLTVPVCAVQAAVKIDLAIDGVLVPAERTDDNTTSFYLEAHPQMRRNNVFVPVRVVSEILGAEVSWENSRINIKYGETNLDLTIDDRTAYKNGQKLTLPAAPYERGGYTYVPIRFVGEAFDCDVEWQAKKNLVNIKTKPLELTGQPVLTVASRVRMTVDIFTYEVQSPFFAAQLYNILTYGCGNEVAEPEYYGDLVNMDPPNYYYQIGNYYFLTDNDRVVAHFEVYDVLHNGYGLPLPENFT